MTDRRPLNDQNETPEDVATLYSWANLHGAKYRDFSASRAQTREKARLRVQQAIEEEQARAQYQTGVEPVAAYPNLADLERSAEMRRMAELARVEEEAHTAELAARRAEREAAQQAARLAAAEQAARQAAEQAAQEIARQTALRAAQQAAEQASREAAERNARQAAQQAELQAARQAAEQASQRLAAQRAAMQAQAAREAAAREAAAQEVAERAQYEAKRRAEVEAAQRAAQQAEQQAAQQRAEQLAAKEAAEQAARQRVEQQAAREAAEQAQAAKEAAHRAEQEAVHREEQEAARRAAQRAAQEREWQQPLSGRLPLTSAPDAAPHLMPKADDPGFSRPEPHAPAQSQPQPAAMHDDGYPQPHKPWGPGDPPESSGRQENAGRPAWLTPDRPEVSAKPPVPKAPEDTLQGSRDRLTSRWFALRGIFEGVGTPVEAAPAPAVARAPVVAVFSLAGGVGKTSLVATLGRALSARGERVLLVDTAPFGLLPFFFGARDQRPGLLRTFSPPGTSGDAPIQMVTIDPEGLGPDSGAQDALTGEIGTHSRGASRVIVDLATASGATTRRILRMSPLVLVPLIPDMNSVVSFSSIDSFFQHNGNPTSKPSLPFYVLNQFDPSLPLHLDIREVLREQLGDRLLPFVLRRAPAVSEALAEGMTVMDYAPNSTVAEDFGSLAGWVKSQSAPASSTYRGVRWSER